MVHVRIVTRQTWGDELSFKDLSKEDWTKLKQQVYGKQKVDWKEFPAEIKHVVFFSELNDQNDEPYYANIYLNGASQACTEDYFEEYYQRSRQFTYAIHRP